MIEFEFGNISITQFDKEKTREWIQTVISNEGENPGTLQFILLNDDKLLEFNQTYLKHDTLTDIITFNYNEEYEGISGDIFISYDRIVENAAKYEVTIINELLRVIVHGVLHLLGYDDHDDASRELMRNRENYYLSLFVF